MKNRNLENHDDWKTPESFYKKLNEEFNFDFDPCPYKHDLTLWDGLEIEWKNRNFINPPYSRKLKDAFVIKAIEEAKIGKLCVMLLPVSTSTKLFHKYIKPNANEIRFIEGRIKFIGENSFGEMVSNKAGMHDSMIVVFDGRQKPFESEPEEISKCAICGKPNFVGEICFDCANGYNCFDINSDDHEYKTRTDI